MSYVITLTVNSLSGDAKTTSVAAGNTLGDGARFTCDTVDAPRIGDSVELTFTVVDTERPPASAAPLLPGAVELPTLKDQPVPKEEPS